MCCSKLRKTCQTWDIVGKCLFTEAVAQKFYVKKRFLKLRKTYMKTPEPESLF